jgi:hypothetical protein
MAQVTGRNSVLQGHARNSMIERDGNELSHSRVVMQSI